MSAGLSASLCSCRSCLEAVTHVSPEQLSGLAMLSSLELPMSQKQNASKHETSYWHRNHSLAMMPRMCPPQKKGLSWTSRLFLRSTLSAVWIPSSTVYPVSCTSSTVCLPRTFAVHFPMRKVSRRMSFGASTRPKLYALVSSWRTSPLPTSTLIRSQCAADHLRSAAHPVNRIFLVCSKNSCHGVATSPCRSTMRHAVFSVRFLSVTGNATITRELHNGQHNRQAKHDDCVCVR